MTHRNKKDDETMVHVGSCGNNKTNVPIENTADDVHMHSGVTYIVGQVDIANTNANCQHQCQWRGKVSCIKCICIVEGAPQK